MTPEGPSSPTWLEILATIGAFSSLVGVAADHVWARKKIDSVQTRSENHRDVEVPVREELTRLADFSGDVADWGANRGSETAQTIISGGIRVSRKLNQTTNIIAKLSHTDATTWISISTEGFDDAISNVSDENKALSLKSLNNCIDRLEKQLLEALADLSLRS